MVNSHTINEVIYDSVIVGGGIVGAGLFREQSLHNIKVLLLEQADFNSQTSQGSSKMLHGGIRYLENLDFFLVFEALKEKKLWLKLAPNLTKEIPLFLPIYKHSKWPLFALRFGLFLYDLLSLFKNPSHKIFNKEKTIKKLKGLKDCELKGAGMYYDGIVDDSKLGLECIYDGLVSKNSHAKNYQKVYRVEKESTDLYRVYFEDKLSGEKNSVLTKLLQFATGPFTDKVMAELNIPWEPIILPSKGSHIYLKKNSLQIEEAMVLQTKDNRIIFVLPSKNNILVGTTEILIDSQDKFLDIKPSQEEIDYLLLCLNEYFPNANISKKDILSSFAAIRPLVREGTSSAKTSRNHRIFNPAPNIFVLAGGKYTTFRKMAEDLNKKIFKTLKIKHNKKLTLQPLRRASTIQNPFLESINAEKIQDIINQEMVRTVEDLITRRLSLPNLDFISDDKNKVDIKTFIKNGTQHLPEK